MKTLPTNRILIGDALTVTKTLPTESVDCIIINPPYLRRCPERSAGWRPGSHRIAGSLAPPVRALRSGYGRRSNTDQPRPLHH